MGRAKLTDDEGRASYSEAVNKFEREYQEYIAELRHRYQWPEKSRRERKWFRLDPRSITTILARLVRRIRVATVIQCGIIAAFISIIIVSAFSLRVH